MTIKILELPANGINLAATLQCGQTFSWQPHTSGEFLGIAGKYAVFARQQGDILLLQNANGGAFTTEDEEFWRHYFALDIDYPKLLQKMKQSKKLARCIEAQPGIRVLRQPFFETLLCFIISQNNHIPRIMGIARRLREEFGVFVTEGVYTYPAPETLAALSPDDLAPLRAGFRARYIIDAAQKVACGQVDEAVLQKQNNADAQKHLMQVTGVGTKVADCVLLYSQGRSDIVPMDVWMKRAMQALFPAGMPKAARGYEGIAQQFIFDWARQNLPGGKA